VSNREPADDDRAEDRAKAPFLALAATASPSPIPSHGFY
jgi:hypothetical protein